MNKPVKAASKTAEESAYLQANSAYQRAWRRDEPLRTAVDEAAAQLLDTPDENLHAALPLLGHYLMTRERLRKGEADTAEKLAAREAAYQLLVAARGY